jgi:hypothetical protein
LIYYCYDWNCKALLHVMVAPDSPSTCKWVERLVQEHCKRLWWKWQFYTIQQASFYRSSLKSLWLFLHQPLLDIIHLCVNKFRALFNFLVDYSESYQIVRYISSHLCVEKTSQLFVAQEWPSFLWLLFYHSPCDQIHTHAVLVNDVTGNTHILKTKVKR